jgi:hypothetical protein
MMKRLKFSIYFLFGMVVFAAVVAAVIHFYSYIFAKRVIGQVVRVERVTEVSTMINVEHMDPSQLYSFAVAIRDERGEIWAASGIDRQWAVVQSGQCVEARLFPYPPWNLEKSGTFTNARLLRLFDCPPGTPKENSQNPPPPAQ